MKYKLFFALMVLSFGHVAKAAPADEGNPRVEYRVHTLLLNENWVPRMVLTDRGYPAPEVPGPYEAPPSDLWIKQGDENKRLRASIGKISEVAVLDGPLFAPGIVETPKAEASPQKAEPSRKSDAKHKEVLLPITRVPLKAKNSLVCLYPAVKKDWRKVGVIVADLDPILARKESATVIVNASSQAIALRLGTSEPLMLKSGATMTIPSHRSEEPMRLQAALFENGKPVVFARTRVVFASGGIPVLAFINADPGYGDGVVTFIRDTLVVGPPAASTSAPGKNGAVASPL